MSDSVHSFQHDAKISGSVIMISRRFIIDVYLDWRLTIYIAKIVKVIEIIKGLVDDGTMIALIAGW